MTSLVVPSACLVDAATDRTLTGSELQSVVAEYSAAYATGLPSGVVFVRIGTTASGVLRYLGAFAAHRAVALLDPGLDPAAFAALVHRFAPAAVLGIDDGPAADLSGDLRGRYTDTRLRTLGRAWVRTVDAGHQPHRDLAVLLATSGSTGDPKLVRLSRAGILSNASAIAEALDINGHDIAPTNLPLFYSYGMSVVNSHLAAGATVVVADGGVVSRSFWNACSRHGATSLAGVPYHFQMLQRIRWEAAKQPTLRKLTVAGGQMHRDLLTTLSRQLPTFVMYGQTEAGPRMTTLPPTWLPAKLGSVGPALRGGVLSVLTPDGDETTAADAEGEIVFRGPNVMMGYARRAADLARGDDLGGRLSTGDLGRLDADRCLWLTGRIRRFAKVFGIRLNLDDIEGMLVQVGTPVAAVSGNDKIILYCEGLQVTAFRPVLDWLAARLHLHTSGFEIRSIERLPLLSSGKIDYRALGSLPALDRSQS